MAPSSAAPAPAPAPAPSPAPTKPPPPPAREPAPPSSLPMRAVYTALGIANGTHPLSRAIAPLLWLLDLALCVVVIWKVPYTEIDWVAYMEQVAQYRGGERDYEAIKGATGPLVYPAAHVYTYSVLYRLTDGGRNVLLAQGLFAGVYMVALAVVMACYRKAGAPPYILPLLILSKRLHSVFMLRCFNDCFVALALWLTIYALQNRQWTAAVMAYSWGLGTKMTLLLTLPALAVVLFQGRGFSGSLRMAGLVAQVHILLSIPFIARNGHGYLARAFELSRVFKFEWTVNWRMLGEDVFLSTEFAALLLALHAAALFAFLTRRWLRPSQRSLWSLIPAMIQGKSPFTPREEVLVAARVTPEFVMTTFLTANVVGLLFARSLHYQFYAYLAWATPFLLWRATGNIVVVYALWGAQEWAWNVFPSTPASSAVVVGVMAATTALVWRGTRQQQVVRATLAKDSSKKTT